MTKYAYSQNMTTCSNGHSPEMRTACCMNAPSIMIHYLDFRADVIRHHTKDNSKGEGSQQEHGVKQNARNEVALIQQIDTCSIVTKFLQMNLG